MKQKLTFLALALLCAAGVSAFVKIQGSGSDFFSHVWSFGAFGAVILGLISVRAKSLPDKIGAWMCVLGGSFLLVAGFLLPTLAK